jgi:hypothetical protein
MATKKKEYTPTVVPPVPYIEPPEGSAAHFWPEDPWDVNLPSSPGFISDFVAHCRGYETPTAYCIWSAIFYLSSVIKREAWIEWGYGKMFCNFFIILVGPPGIVKKGTVMELGFEVFDGVRKHLRDPNFKEMKRFNVLRNKASAEALVSVMAENRKKHGEHFDFVDAGGNLKLVKGKPIRYHRTSEISIIVPELATMLSRADYARPITTVLMDLYDCKDSWEVSTQSRGKEVLTNLCTNFFGGVTPKGLAKSIPEEASEDGFLSRCALVYQKTTNRCYPEPIITGPTVEELSKKLAWIAENTIGVHKFSPEAKLFYGEWYKKWRKMLESSDRPYASSRMAVQARQLSLIIKASRFSKEPIIELDDIKDAVKIIEKTAGTYKGLFERVDSNVFFDKLSVVEGKIFRKKKMKRREILTTTRNTSEELNAILGHLVQAGRIKIYRNGVEETFVSKDGKEEYRWVNGVKQIQTEQDEHEATNEE